MFSRVVGSSGLKLARQSFGRLSRFCFFFVGIISLLTSLSVQADPALTGGAVQSIYMPPGYFYVTWSGGNLAALLEAQTAPYNQGGTNKTSYSPAGGTSAYTITGKAAGIYYYTGVYLGSGGFTGTNDVAIILYRTLPVINSYWGTAYAGNALPIGWSTSAPAGGYILEQQYNGGAWTQIYFGATPSYTTGALAAGTYKFRVRPVTGYSAADFTSAEVTTTVLTPPTLTGDYQPTSGYQSVYLGGTTGNYTVNWTGGDVNALLEAQTAPYLQSTATNKVSYSPAANARSFTVTGKPRGIYYYTGFLGLCNNCAVTNDLIVIAYDQLPVVTAPTNNGTGTFGISWSTVWPAGLYTLEQQVNGGAWTSLTPTATATTSYSAAGLLSGTYKYRVHPCYYYYCAPFTSAEVSTIVASPPPATTMVAPASSTTGTYSLTWLSALTATSYQVDQSVNYGSWTNIYAGSATGTNLFGNPDGFYQYRVRACNANGCSSYSPIQSTSVLNPPIAAQFVSWNGASSDGRVNAQWSAAPTATSYNLKQRTSGGSSWSTVYSGSLTNFSQSGLAAGAYDFQVQACNASGCTDSTTASVTVSNTTTFPNGQTPISFSTVLAQFTQADIDNSDVLGTTDGQFRVDESGAATYKIPIFATPGTAGVTPQLSLSYDSQGGNGLLGQGWSLGGLSEISRCRQTLQQDNNPLAITWTNQDRFCLDGQRLVVVSGNYGDPNSVYKTEIDSYVRVTALGGSAGSPNYFKVEKKDGSTSFYGDAPASADPSAAPMGGDPVVAGKVYANNDPTNKTYTWKLRKFQDSVGNAIWYQHAWSWGWFLSEVRYAYGASTGPDNYGARLLLSVEARNDFTSTGYAGGYSFRMNAVRYNKIAVENAGNVVRTYNFTYKENESFSVNGQTIPLDLSRMTSIQECAPGAAGNTLCKPATQFVWSDTSGQMGISASNNVSASLGSSTRNRVFGALIALDVNGDGCPDWAWTETNLSSNDPNNRTYLRYSIGDCQGHWTPASFDGGSSLDFSVGSSDTFDAFDYNADGRTDLLRTISGTGTYQALLSVPQADGSWKLSVVGVAVAGVTHPDGSSASFQDTNADGLADYVKMDDAGVYIKDFVVDTSQAISSNHYYQFSSAQRTYSTSWGAQRRFASFADFNGDGRMDLAVTWGYTVNNYAVGISGPSTISTVPTAVDGVDTPAARSSVDINGDGLPDLVYQKSCGAGLVTCNGGTPNVTSLLFQLNTGTGFGTETYIGAYQTSVTDPLISSTYSQHGITFMDYNQDGMADLVIYDWPNAQMKIRLWNKASQSFDPDFVLQSFVTSPAGAQRYYPTYMWMDVNGDGVADLVTKSGNDGDTISVQFGNGANQPRHVITQITNGLGAQTAISYEPLNKSTHYTHLNVGTSQGKGLPCPSLTGLHAGFSAFDFPCNFVEPDSGSFYSELNGGWRLPPLTQTLGKSTTGPILEWVPPVYVVTEIRGTAPATTAATLGSVNTNAQSVIDYYYGEAKIQAGGRGLLGFQSITTKDMQTQIVTQNTYRQDFPFIGLPLSTKVYTSDNKLIRASINYWSFQNWGNGHATAPYLPVLSTTLDWSYESGGSGNPLIAFVQTNNIYDGFGNSLSTQINTYSDLNGTNLVASTQTSNTYGLAVNPDMQRLGRLTQTVVTSSRPGKDNVVRTSQFNYYCMESGPCTGSQQALKGMLAQEIVEPQSAYMLTTNHEYDQFGNPSKTTTNAADMPSSRYSRWEYDTLGRYKDRTFNSIEQKVEEVVSRNKLGEPTQINGLNNAVAKVGYGAFGRKYLEYSNNGAYATTFLVGALGDCPAGAVMASIVRKGGGSASGACYDKLARSVREYVAGFGSGSKIYVDTEYDSLGRVVHRSIPHYLNDPNYPSPASVPITTTTYDSHVVNTVLGSLGRVIKTTYPDATFASAAYYGLQTTYTDANGHVKNEYKNVLGELDHVVDHNGTQIQYAYNANGTLSATTLIAGGAGMASVARASGVPSSIITTFSYDAVGRKIQMSDPDKGAWKYAYYINGELKNQTDAKNQTISFQYDRLGRMASRIDCAVDASIAPCPVGSIKGNTAWHFDTAINGVGQLDYVQDVISGYIKAVTYDSYGRISQVGTSPISGENYYEGINYDQYGRVLRKYDASSLTNGTENVYNVNGYLSQVKDVAANQAYYTINTMDAMGHVTEEINGAVTTNRTYNTMGRLLTINSQVYGSTLSGLNPVQNLAYHYDAVGNMDWRKDYNRNLTETFAYDELNRLSADTVGANSTTISYDSFGNIASKSDVGSYGYGAGTAANGCTAGAGVHAALSAGGATYTYDCNGNSLSGDGRTISYTVYDKPISISKNSFTSQFSYDTERNFFRRIDNNNGQVTTTTTMGGVEKVVHPDSTYEIRRYVAGAIITSQYSASGGQISSTSQYVLKDHLGSIDMIIDQHGNVVGAANANASQAMSFDPWGWRRNVTLASTAAGTNWTGLSVSALNSFSHPVTNKGFTGHEMVDESGIIHMGGRIYDPRIGRFLQADPFIQSPASTQSYNRYSYVWNNPLGSVDPSGYFSWSHLVDPQGIFDHGLGGVDFMQVWNAGVTAMAYYACDGAPICVAAAQAFIIKAEGGTWNQALKGGAIAYASSWAFQAYGQDFSTPAAAAETIVVHGTIGGITSMLQGGNFGSGFASAGIAAFTAGMMPSSASAAERIAVEAVAGGTASELTGGKFANGAITAAFAAAMGEAASANDGTPVNANTDRNAPDFSKTPAPASGDVVGTPEMDQQAIDLAEETRIGRNETAITVTAKSEVEFKYGGNSNAACFAGGGGLCFHTHPKQDYGGAYGRNASQAHRLVFSPGDANIVQQGLPNYMLNYQRQLQVLEYRSDAGGYVPRVIQNVPYRGDE